MERHAAIMKENEQRLIIAKEKGIATDIDTKEYPDFRLRLVAADIAVYTNRGDEVLVMDLRTKEIMEEKAGLMRYSEAMDKIVNQKEAFEFGELFVQFCKERHCFERPVLENVIEGQCDNLSESEKEQAMVQPPMRHKRHGR